MNSLKNKVQIIGNLEADPETKEVGQSKISRFVLLTVESYRNSDGIKVTEKQRHLCYGWGKNAEIIERFLKRNSEVAIEGKLINKKMPDAEGVTRHFSEIEISELLMIEQK